VLFDDGYVDRPAQIGGSCDDQETKDKVTRRRARICLPSGLVSCHGEVTRSISSRGRSHDGPSAADPTVRVVLKYRW
jgi:hypothetical protein